MLDPMVKRRLQAFAQRNTQQVWLRRGMRWAWSLVRLALLCGLAFIILYPVIIQIASSFKSAPDLYDNTVFLIPREPTLYNYQRVMEYLDYGSTFLRTVLFSAAVGLTQALSCTLVAYGLARFRFRGKKLIFGLVIFTLAVPPQALLMPLYTLFQNFSPAAVLSLGFYTPAGLELLNTPWPFLLMGLGAVGFKNGLYIYMLRQYYLNVPASLEEAAYIDGCGAVKTFVRIMLPGAVPLLVTVFLFSFVWQWNDYFYTSALGPGLDILATKLNSVGFNITANDGDAWNALQQSIYNNTAIVLQMIPLILLYIFTQKFFVQSIERSGIVG